MKSMDTYSAVFRIPRLEVLFYEHHLKQVLFHGFSPEVWFIMVRKKRWNRSLSVSCMGCFAQMNVPSSMVSLEHSITLLRTPRSKITCTHTIVQPERLQSTKYNWMPSQALTAWRPLHDPSAVLINLSRYATYPWVMDWRVLAPHWNEAS